MKKIFFAISLSLCSLYSFAAENTSRANDFDANNSADLGREVSITYTSICGVTYTITASCDDCGYEALAALLASGVYYADALCYNIPTDFEIAPE
ncbi:MAG: hypothetical protein E6Q35_04095 [Chryseobacterium cucumeris]|nr:MAG: hypothetical protein E6Q35_04095 [Chryseobacterium cucumeris]